MQNQNDIISEVMQSLGLGNGVNGSNVPLANEENRRLLQELEQMREQRMQCAIDEEQAEARLSKIDQYSKIAAGGFDHNLKLLYALQTDMRTETSMQRVAEREHNKLKQDCKKLDKDTANMKAYVCQTEKELSKRQQNIDELTGRIQWAKTALMEWNEAMADSHKGYQLIEKYFQEDEQKARVQEQRRQRLQAETEHKRTELVGLKNEQRSLEQTLECTAQLYRGAHTERRQLVETWKLAVTQMLQRERDIKDREEQLKQIRIEADRQLNEYQRQDKRLNDLLENNRSVEEAISELNNETSELKDKIQRTTEAVALKTNEVDVLQKELHNLDGRVQQQRIQNRKNLAEQQKREMDMAEFQQVHENLNGRKQSMQDKNLSAQQRLQLLDELMDGENKAKIVLTKETGRLNELIFRSQQQLVEFRNEEKILQVSKSGIQVTTQALHKTASNTEKELQRQTENQYNMSFRCVELERRIVKLLGEAITPEQEQHQLEQLAAQEVLLAAAQRRLDITEQQNNKLDSNITKLTSVIQNDTAEVERMHSNIKQAQTYCESGVKRTRETTARNQTLIVELSLLRLRASEFEEEIQRCADCAYNLERHRAELQRSIEDRMAELRGQQELLQSKRKQLEEERATLRADVGERTKHISAVRARFELTAQLLGTNDDGSLVTATQMKIEAAQERQLLLAEGNALNERVLIAEQEIKALENTLVLVNASNEAYRHGFRNIPEGEEAKEELKQMQLNYCNELNCLKKLRVQLMRLDRDRSEAERERDRLDSHLNEQMRKCTDCQDILQRLQKELLDQQVKIQRAEREMKLALKKARQQRGIAAEIVALFGRDLDVRDQEYRNTKALNQLSDLAAGDNALAIPLLQGIQERGLRMPPQLLRAAQGSGASAMTWRSEDLSEMSLSSSRDLLTSTSRSSITSSSARSRIRGGTVSTPTSARVSIVSIDFDVPPSAK